MVVEVRVQLHTWPTSSCSSCFCISSGTPHTASALVRLSVALIHGPIKTGKSGWSFVHTLSLCIGWLVSVVLSVLLHKYDTCLMPLYMLRMLFWNHMLAWQIHCKLEWGSEHSCRALEDYIPISTDASEKFQELCLGLSEFHLVVLGALFRTCGTWSSAELQWSSGSGLQSAVTFVRTSTCVCVVCTCEVHVCFVCVCGVHVCVQDSGIELWV